MYDTQKGSKEKDHQDYEDIKTLKDVHDQAKISRYQDVQEIRKLGYRNTTKYKPYVSLDSHLNYQVKIYY